MTTSNTPRIPVELHADDYGITIDQAHALLDIMQACREAGAITGLSIFANSPCFDEAAALARPHTCTLPFDREASAVCANAEDGASVATASAAPVASVPADGAAFTDGATPVLSTRLRLHVNLVEGSPCTAAASIPLLVNERGTFAHDFVSLLRLSIGHDRETLKQQITCECKAQISRFTQAFPEAKGALMLDSHQHVHAIPLVCEALLDAACACECKVAFLRSTAEPLAAHRAAGTLRYASPINLVKVALLDALWRRSAHLVPPGCATATLCGVALSGDMARATPELARALEEHAKSQAHAPGSRTYTHIEERQNTSADATRGRKPAGANAARRLREAAPLVEMLFHPVSIPLASCLDPENKPFAAACASPSRDAEAQAIMQLTHNI